MNASTIIGRAGLAANGKVSGETLSLVVDANTVVSGIASVVNRNIIKGRDFMRLFKDYAGDFEVMGLTEIMIDKVAKATQTVSPGPVVTVVTVPQPEAGMYFTDSVGYKHRVRYVTQTPVAWMAYCTPSQLI